MDFINYFYGGAPLGFFFGGLLGGLSAIAYFYGQFSGKSRLRDLSRLRKDIGYKTNLENSISILRDCASKDRLIEQLIMVDRKIKNRTASLGFLTDIEREYINTYAPTPPPPGAE